MTSPPSTAEDLGLSPSARVLVTGGGGFLGTGIVKALVRGGLRVRSFSRSRYAHLKEMEVEQVQGDLSDAEAVQKACQGCHMVFHSGAKAGIWGPREAFYNSNVKGTQNVIQSCLRNGVRRLVYTSSPSVVFDGDDMEGADESTPYPERFHAFYPETKAKAEQEILEANGTSLATVALRPHLIWGPEDPHIIPGILKRARTGALRQIGSEPKLVDFTFVDNAVAAHLQAAARLTPGSAVSGKAYFITDGEPVILWDFINRLLSEAGIPPVRKVISPSLARVVGWTLENIYRALHVRSEPRLTYFLALELSTAHWFDISAARAELGYQPVVGLEEGLSRVRAWLCREPV